MIKLSTACLFMFFCVFVNAQGRYASSIQAYSSEYGSCWGVVQILGPSNVTPGCGDKCGSWAQSGAENGREYVELVFSGTNTAINTIRIWESNAPGAIDTLYVWNTGTATWETVMTRTAAATPCMFPDPIVYHFPTTSFPVDKIRIALNSAAVPGWNEYDAVMIDSIGLGGSIGGEQSVCISNGTPTMLTNVDSSFNGDLSATYQWQDSVASGTWQNIASATGITYQPGSISQTTYYRRTATLNSFSANSNTITVTYLSSGDPSIVPADSWNFYGYQGSNIDLSNSIYKGYYNSTSLNINTQNEWGANNSPSTAATWIGCTLNPDNFILVAKRTGFTTSPYVLQVVTYDDWLQVYKNGTLLFFNNGAQTISLGQLSTNDTIEIRLQEFGGGANFQVNFLVQSLTGGTIGSNQLLCMNDVPAMLNNITSASGGNSPSTITYQWQDSVVSGTWQNISGANAATYQPPALVANTWYRRLVTDAASGAAVSNIIALSVVATAGDPTVLPLNSWNFYGFNTFNLNFDISNYRGYYNLATQGFDTRNQWDPNASPASAAGWQGCPMPNDNFSEKIWRKGFTDNPYIANISGDDNHEVYKNGILIYQGSCCGYNPNISLGRLTPADTIEIRHQEGGGGAYVLFDLQVQTLAGGTISGAQTVCGSDVPAQLNNNAAAYGGYMPTFTYQWQDSVATGTWTNIPGANAVQYQSIPVTETTWFRRMVTDGNADVAFSNIIQVSFAQRLGDTSLSGNNSWNVYAYNGTDPSLAGNNYRGYYTEDNLDFDSRIRWDQNGSPQAASGYAGCPVGSDNFTLQFKRRGFPAGNYNLQIPGHDDNIYVYKNGTLLYSAGCCNTNPTISLGFLNADSVIEMRMVEGGGGAYLAVTFIQLNSSIYDYVNNNCNQFQLNNVSGTNWWDITDNTGKLIASVNPNGNNLGNITARIRHFGNSPGNIPTSNHGIKYMPRYYDLQSSAYPNSAFPTPVSVKLYFYNAELDDYKTATNQPALQKSDLVIYHYDGPNEDCDITNNPLPSVPKITTTSDYGATAFLLQASVPSFSEFGVSGGTENLPVTGLDLKAFLNGKTVSLQWSTLSEINNSGFSVLRSNDGINFTAIGWVASQGNSNSRRYYSFTDPAPMTGINYYRLKQTDLDNRSVLSEIKQINMNDIQTIFVYPNPFKSVINLQNVDPNATYRILDAKGSLILQGKVVNNQINAGALAKDVYIFELNINGKKQLIKVIRE